MKCLEAGVRSEMQCHTHLTYRTPTQDNCTVQLINQHQADAKPRIIVRRLSSWKQKEAVVRKARKEKPEGLFICEDLSQATLEKRKPHLEKLKAAKQAGKSAYFILDRLIIRDKPSGSSND